MKKHTILFLLSLLTITGCFFPPSEDLQPGDVFFLTDRDGNKTTSFSSGESFHMLFQLINTTQDSLNYSYTVPAISFTIYNGLTRVVGSHDGLDFIQVVVDKKLAPGDTLEYWWMAPTPAHWSSIKTLPPGKYRAVARFPNIEELHTDTISDIIFTVTQ